MNIFLRKFTDFQGLLEYVLRNRALICRKGEQEQGGAILLRQIALQNHIHSACTVFQFFTVIRPCKVAKVGKWGSL